MDEDDETSWMHESNWKLPTLTSLSALDQGLVSCLVRIIRAQEAAMPIDHSLEAGGMLSANDLLIYESVIARPSKR